MEKKCKYCAMMIPKEAKICPHCRKSQGTSLGVLVLTGIFVLIGIAMCSDFGSKSGDISSPESKTSQLDNFFRGCFKDYPKDADVCVRMAQARGYSFDDIEAAVKRTAPTSKTATKKKRD